MNEGQWDRAYELADNIKHELIAMFAEGTDPLPRWTAIQHRAQAIEALASSQLGAST